MPVRSARARCAVIAVMLVLVGPAGAAESDWSAAELRTLRGLWIGSLGPVPDDPSNAYDTDPRAAALGRALFFDTRFSATGTLACASCHDPARSFQDGKPVAEGVGRLTRRSMPLLGVGYNTWFFWDGRKDSLWSQALTPLENPLELGLTPERIATLVGTHHRADYVAIFGPLPAAPRSETAATRVAVNVAKAIAAFVRTLVPGPARFDHWVEARLAGTAPRADRNGTLAAAEIRGLRLFIGRAHCTNCHAGPLFTNGEFHFTRVPQANDDPGRSAGIALVEGDELNCRGPFSDARPEQCDALRFMDRDTRDTLRAFKTPTLRNVAVRPPYMNAGQLASLADVLRFYRDGARTHGAAKELSHGDLSDADLADLVAFLGTLTEMPREGVTANGAPRAPIR